MHTPPHSKPSAEDALRLHQRLLERDPVAPADFAVAFLNPLITWLQTTNAGVDPMACEEAAGEAIVGFLIHPTKYDPQRLGVEAFLRMAAQRDLQNLLRKERRHQRKRRGWKVVEQASEDGKYLQRDDDPSLTLQIDEVRQRQELPDAVWQQLTDVERRCWEQMQQGERRHSVFAALLGVTHLPVEEQKREVKRVKDRLKKRSERAGGKDGRFR
jgi:RNA polymerase sigma-70 factor (ECF subfamily)